MTWNDPQVLLELYMKGRPQHNCCQPQATLELPATAPQGKMINGWKEKIESISYEDPILRLVFHITKHKRGFVVLVTFSSGVPLLEIYLLRRSW